MKGWVLTEPNKLEEREITENTDLMCNTTKVRITKALITRSDLLRYMDESDVETVALGSSGIGLITESDNNLFDLEKGKRVFVEPYKDCGKCYNCLKGDKNKCSDIQIAGEDYDGFLRDFMTVSQEKLFVLPESVSDEEAMFIDKISLAMSIFDKLDIQKGDYVAVIGANNLGNILAQLLIYYQAVPIVMTLSENDYKTAKDSGIYYVLGPNDNWQKETSTISSGRMTNKVVYISDCNIPASKAFSLASFNAAVVFTGYSNKSNPVSLMQAVKKQLDILCVNSGINNSETSINLIANKAINFSKLKNDYATYSETPEVFEKSKTALLNGENPNETVIKMI